jgi:hypothetical protein
LRSTNLLPSFLIARDQGLGVTHLHLRAQHLDSSPEVNEIPVWTGTKKARHISLNAGVELTRAIFSGLGGIQPVARPKRSMQLFCG